MSIVVENLTHIYGKGTPNQVVALDNVNLSIQDGEFVGIIGPTGSGKSTLVQHLNGLLKPTSGRVLVDGIDIGAKGVNLRDIRRRVGLIFQYPEHQLFEETVYADVAFGPRNVGLAEEEVRRRVVEAIRSVGLDESVLERSPFELSGGQMRRVAIAGVLAMMPGTLVLDEPTAGLDPRGRDDILEHVRTLHREKGITVILVSHNMEDIARLASRVVVMHRGRIIVDAEPRIVFSQVDILKEIGLAPPELVELMLKLKSRGWDVRTDVLTVAEARQEILRFLKERSRCSGA